jgi:hypothetical protein
MELFTSQGLPKYTNLKRDEISSKSIVRGVENEISKNVQSFNFSVGPYELWKPRLSHWVMRFSIEAANGVQLNIVNDIAPALNAACNWIQYAHFYANNQKIDELSEHVGEVAAIRTRLEKSKSWFDSIGKTQIWDTNFKIRQNIISGDAPTGNDAALSNYNVADLVTIPNIGTAVGDNVTIANGALAGTSRITLANGTIADARISPGDFLTFNNGNHGNAGITVRIISISGATTIEVGPRLVANAATPYVAGDITVAYISNPPASVEQYVGSTIPSYNARDNIEIPFKLPLGICYLDDLGPGDFEFRIRGFSANEFKKRLVEHLNSNVDPANFRINVQDFYYYPYIVETDQRMDDVEITKTFKCYQAQKKKILANSNQLQYTINSNASAVGFGLQDNRVGSNSQRISASKLVSYADGGGAFNQQIHKALRYYQIRYANKYIPEPSQQDNFYNDRTSNLAQSYIDTYKNSGALYLEGGMESYSDYLDRGPIYFWQMPRDKNTYATECRLDLRFVDAIGGNNIDFSTINTDAVLFWTYFKTVRFTVKEGKIVGIVRS